jgi:hypothetical protein
VFDFDRARACFADKIRCVCNEAKAQKERGWKGYLLYVQVRCSKQGSVRRPVSITIKPCGNTVQDTLFLDSSDKASRTR